MYKALFAAVDLKNIISLWQITLVSMSKPWWSVMCEEEVDIAQV